jgi:hypothetical protein
MCQLKPITLLGTVQGCVAIAMSDNRKQWDGRSCLFKWLVNTSTLAHFDAA